jgi:hypothetical protein
MEVGAQPVNHSKAIRRIDKKRREFFPRFDPTL